MDSETEGQPGPTPDSADGRRGSRRARIAWRALAGFWGFVTIAGAAGLGTLQFLGPPHAGVAPAHGGHGPAPEAHAEHAGATGHDAPSHATDAAAEHAGAAAHDAPSHASDAAAEHASHPGPPSHEAGPSHAVADPHAPPPRPPATESRAPGAPIPAPIAALQEAAGEGATLPRIGPDGTQPMAAYAAGAAPAEGRPRIALLLGGIGESGADSDEATHGLPPAISFAVSPYSMQFDRLLGDIRAAGHEILAELPMEPQGFPLNDEGNQSMMTTSPPEQNEARLNWALSRFGGFVGATNALDGMRGERFVGTLSAIAPVLKTLASRGLLFVDATTGDRPAPIADTQGLAGRRVDVIVDEPPVRSEIDLKLAALEQIARSKGAALGLAGLPRPVTLSRIAAWAGTLAPRGLVLVPVSALAPAAPAVASTEHAAAKPGHATE